MLGKYSEDSTDPGWGPGFFRPRIRRGDLEVEHCFLATKSCGYRTFALFSQPGNLSNCKSYIERTASETKEGSICANLASGLNVLLHSGFLSMYAQLFLSHRESCYSDFGYLCPYLMSLL
jgi:hypothetical protein